MRPCWMAAYPKFPTVIKTSQRWPRLRVKVNTRIPTSVRIYMAKRVCLGTKGAQTSSFWTNENEAEWSQQLAFVTLISPLNLKSNLAFKDMIIVISVGCWRQHTDSTVSMRIAISVLKRSLEHFGPVQPNATQEWSQNPSKDESQANSPSILLLALGGEITALRESQKSLYLDLILVYLLILCSI